MKFLLHKAVVLACLACFFPLVAQAEKVPELPNLDVKSYLLVDADSGMIMAQKNADVAMDPASITKVMTAYVVFAALDAGEIGIDDEVVISEEVWRAVYGKGESIMFLEPDHRVSVEDLLKGMIVQSGNDAALALAQYVGGSEAIFLQRMNQTAEVLGMTRSQFKNISGLSQSGHYMSAVDMVTLSRDLIRRFAQQYTLFKQREYAYNNIMQRNRNALLWRDDSVDGIKTGKNSKSGYCLLSSARRGDMRLISVVLGAENRKQRVEISQRLLDYGFRHYETHRLYGADQILARARIWKGTSNEVSLGLEQDLYISIPRGAYKRLQAKMDILAEQQAPVNSGDEFGAVRIMLDNEVVHETPLIAKQSVAAGNLLRRMYDSLRMLFY